MLSRLTRPAALASVALCSLALLTACGDDDSGEKQASGFDAVSISGAVGEVPTFDWKAALKPGKTESEVLDEGDGPAIADGDQVLVNIAVSDDFSQDVVVDSFGPDRAASIITVGEEAEPQQAFDLITQLVGEHIDAGMTVGTRIALTADVKKEWGDTGLFLTGIDVGNEDGIAIVADLQAVPLDAPDGKRVTPAKWAPKIDFTKDLPSGLDSAGIPKPDVKGKEIRSTTVLEGTGPEIEEGDLAVVNYLGQTWGGDKPFDTSFDKKRDPLLVNVGVTDGGGITVIDGWSDGLVGVPVGSRIILEIPPAKGYGKKGQGEDIKGDDILYFVVDVLAAA
ncbi:FKBP-type peptidyl-prolyl cis-trans isomerase [Nocardioides humilatus]|uniref:peptidylprolyl isomerase n=1 Tax=Nocardioides humilatus TaxID=2607660 RepID=A0A5B1L7Z6_9ACTN|nr:FKBP-type peptidyl-prolyl cis-trans isomerase [Nocardioides humilatus]KAA1415890.1 FKBP-type peptidyl-prolyl cis-trans isomerase [Nocardioides humilatus]